MQHEMEMRHGAQDQVEPGLAYEGERVRPPSAYHLYGQKLSGGSISQAASPGQRLALAIVSLSLLVFLILGLTIFAAADNAPNWAVIPIIFVFLLFSAVAVAINYIFNRRI